MSESIMDIHCPNCGGIAKFDILSQRYLCGYCGNQVSIHETREEKQKFKKILAQKLKHTVNDYHFFTASCNSCGAEVYFEENEAVSTCPFCGKTMVRKNYVHDENTPAALIPFGITPDEAKDRMSEWCAENRGKKEAKLLKKEISSLKGFYLPYELVYGPVHMSVSRMDKGNAFQCESFLKESFVNCSSQLDNLLLDGMEPFEADGLKEFDYGYIAGQRVKISDIDEKQLTLRIRKEAAETCRPFIRKTLGTKAVNINADTDSALRMSVLLPVYYICKNGLMAAVNGQTGKAAVRSLKDSHYYFLPWWLKAVLAAIIFTLISFLGLYAFGINTEECLLITGILALFFIIVLLCYYSDASRNPFRIISGRKIYTSGEKTFRRENGELVLNDEILRRRIEEPVFFEEIDHEKRPVILKFMTPFRAVKIAILCMTALFLPVIFALLINGFRFSDIDLSGSTVWFCIAVPVIPVYLLKYGIDEIYERPLIYLLKENGSKKKYHKKPDFKTAAAILKKILKALIVPPVSLAVWFGIICFITTVFLTAGYK